jgi:hypothetical protein
MTMRPSLKLAIAALVAAIAFPLTLQAHRQWLLPSATVLSGTDRVTIDAAISNDLFKATTGHDGKVTVTMPEPGMYWIHATYGEGGAQRSEAPSASATPESEAARAGRGGPRVAGDQQPVPERQGPPRGAGPRGQGGPSGAGRPIVPGRRASYVATLEVLPQ